MKFAVLALIAGASAIKLHQKSTHVAHVPATNYVKIAHMLKSKVKDKKPEECPTPEEKEEVEAWFHHVMADGKITKEEAKDGLAAAAAANDHELSPDEWAEAEAIFDAIDTSGDGAWQMAELEAIAEEAAAAYEEHCGEAW